MLAVKHADNCRHVPRMRGLECTGFLIGGTVYVCMYMYIICIEIHSIYVFLIYLCVCLFGYVFVFLINAYMECALLERS